MVLMYHSAMPTEPRWDLEGLRGCIPEFIRGYRGPVPSNGRWIHARSPWYACWLVERGWAEVRLGARRLRAGPGEWLCNAARVARYQGFSGDAAIVSIAFGLPTPTPHPLDRALPLCVGRVQGAALAEAGRDLVATLGGYSAEGEIHYRRRRLDLGRWLAVQTALLGFVAEWYRCVTPAVDGTLAVDCEPDPRVRAARDELAANPRVGPVPYPALRARTGLGRVQLDRLFRRDLGHSPKVELDRLCLQEIRRQLDVPGRPLKAVAAACGLTDASHLCHWFRRHVGMSPQEYRRGTML